MHGVDDPWQTYLSKRSLSPENFPNFNDNNDRVHSCSIRSNIHKRGKRALLQRRSKVPNIESSGKVLSLTFPFLLAYCHAADS